MNKKLMEILACPECHGGLKEAEGALLCGDCGKAYPVVRGIPRFVESQNYASSFGYQWNKFTAEQLDSYNGTNCSEKRLYSETGWSKDWMEGKWILDAGCGAGRFLDVASKSKAFTVGIDISNSVEGAQRYLKGRDNVFLVQASIYKLPFRDSTFDGLYCIGVIQHTPDPAKTLGSLPRVLKKGGKIAVTIYEKRRWTLFCGKYLVRPLTKRMNKKTLLFMIRLLMPVIFPITEVLFRIGGLNKLFAFVIPVANYVDNKQLSIKQRYDWAIMDTFDMLSPYYDQPQTQADAERSLRGAGIGQIRRMAENPGLNLTGVKS
ncbi:MAG: methyltransferase domain-containing protein [Candidatus Omnitrophota bacterium]